MMSMLTWARNLGLMFVAVMFVNLTGVGKAAACKCLPPTVESSYKRSTDVVAVEILKTQTTRTTRTYLARVLRTFKGCLKQDETIVVTTPTSSATCGAELSARRHLINGIATGKQGGRPVLSINSCSYNVAIAALTEHDREFLNGRTVCCGEVCTCADGTTPVNCLVDPCSVAPKCSEGECQANYCGGCNAEFYDANGYAVCEDPASCEDLAGIDFGSCKRLLGAGVVNGKCQAIGGCDAQGHTLFADVAACEAACGTTPPVCPASCHPTGCSGQICAAEDVITTCEWRPEYACYQDPAITQCGCNAGSCGWAQTDALAKCLAAAGGI